MVRKAEARPDPEQRIIDAALALAEREGWRRTGLAAIASEAKLPLHEVYARFRSRGAILAGFLRRVDQATLAGADANAGEAPRDRLFDTIMRRLEALQPHKPAIRSLTREGFGDPGAALCGAPLLLRSMGWMLEASGVSATGSAGRVRAALLAGLYMTVLRHWLEDDTPDMSRTMSSLDRLLRRAAPWLGIAGEAPARAAPDAA